MLNNQILWYHFHYIKNHILLYVFFTIFIFCARYVQLDLLQTFTYIFIIILNYELYVNIKKFFNVEYQIICIWPWDMKYLIKKIAISAYIKIVFFLILFVLIKFENINPLNIAIIGTFLLVCYLFNLFTYILKFTINIRYFFIILNLCFGVLYFIWDFIQHKSGLFIIFVNLVVGTVLHCLSKKLAKKISFEKNIQE